MPLVNNVVDTGNFTNHIETVWSPRIFLDTTEEMSIGNKFLSNSDLDISKVAGGLVIRKVAAKSAVQAAGTVELDTAGGMTFEVDAETAVTLSPTFRYSAVAVTKQVQTRYMAFPKYDKAVREQFLRTLAQDIDQECGGLGDNLSVTTGAANLDAALIRGALGLLRTNAQREYKIGKITAVLRIHPSQAANLYGIAEITNANLRGDSDNPNVTGMLVEAWGCDVDITGNIVNSGGNRHNMLFVKPAFALGYNEEPQLAKPQENGLATLIMAFADAGAVELYDNYAVDIQTTA